MAGGLRDVLMIKDFHMVAGFFGIFIAALITNIFLGKVELGFEGQAIAHSDHIWNFLGLSVVGFSAVLLGGCPLRQLILTGQGNLDSAVTVLGMLMGGAISHNFNLAASPAGTTANGKIAVVICLLAMGVLAYSYSKKNNY